jgi:hypothetical protein
MRRTVGKTVGIKVGEGSAGYSGLAHCGRVLCPNCGPQISAVRRTEINTAVTNWRASGGRVLFGTLTLRHNRSQPFRLLVSAIGKAWRAATGGRTWIEDRREHGLEHFIRVWEEKWSIENGWHLHVHFLLFIEKDTEAHPELLLAAMFGRWRDSAKGSGLDAPWLRGQDLHEVIGENADALGFYFAKQSTENGDDTASEIAWELTGSNTKTRGDSFTPAEIRALATGGDDSMQALWAEYEQGMKGRRTIAFSRGLREELDVKSEQEIVDEELGGETVLTMPTASWLKFSRRPGARRELLDHVDDFGAASAVAWLRSNGFSAWEGPPGGDEDE